LKDISCYNHPNFNGSKCYEIKQQNGVSLERHDNGYYVWYLNRLVFEAKIHAPLSEHQNSGHTHVVALCNLKEKLRIGGVESYV